MIKRVAKYRLPVAVLMAAAALSGCGKSEQGWDQGPATVEVVTLQAQPFALSSELPGRVEPVRVAEVRARVAGIVLSRNFTEGSDVKAGQVLFQIDPAPFKATLARAEAALFEARATVQRYEPLVKIEAVSQQDFDVAQAAYKTAEANMVTARLEVDYATVRAPISGRIGRALVTEGALVGQGEVTPLATIQQIDPVYVDFKQPVAAALQLRAALAEGRLAQDEGKGARISARIDGIDETREGHLLFSDISVDRTTGQVSLRGRFDNADGLLLPGMYVRVQTPQGVDPKAILVPQRAVQRGADGKAQVIVVGKGDVAELRPVKTGTMHAAQWHIVEGLEPGERVVVGSAGTVQPGAKVSITALGAGKSEAPATSAQ